MKRIHNLAMALLVVAATLIPSLNYAQTATLYGYAKSGWSQGMYEFSADASGKLAANFLNGGVGESSGAGCYSNGKYYMMSQFKYGTTVFANSFYTYDAETWAQLNFADLDLNLVATTMTYNPGDSQFYGCFTTGSGYQFGTLNAQTGKLTTVKTLTAPLAVIAADAQGQLFAITSDGELQRLDARTGEATAIGATGLTPGGLQDGCFDAATGELYWAAYGTGADGLYTVSTTTGKATKVGSWADGQPQFVGIFSKTTAGDAGNSDPSYVDNFALNFDKASLSGTIEFDMPTKDYDGADLKGALSYVLEIDEVEVKRGDSPPGAHVSIPVEVAEGVHKFGARAVNKAGNGPTGTITRYIGNDTPKAPEHFQATKQADETVALSWDAVEKGVNDGYINAPAIVYNIVRYPDEVIIAEGCKATSCVDALPVTNIGTYFYTLVATNGQKSSEALNSNQVALGTTDPIVPPYNRKFNDGMGLAYYTVVDANEDGVTWVEDEKHVYYLHPDDNQDGDDWLFTPALRLNAETLYKVSATIMSPNPNFYETFEVCYGTAPTPEGMKYCIVDETQVNETYNLEEWIEPAEAGVYYIGIHAMEPTQWALYVLDLAVGAGESLNGPAAGVAKATAAPMGAMGATVSFTCPTKTINDKPLTGLTRAEVLNTVTGMTVGVIDQPEVGGTYAVTDPNPVEGQNDYIVTCANEEGNGRGAETWCWVGLDVPSAPETIEWRQDGDKAVITWSEPLPIGMHGGYVDVSEVTFNIWNLNSYERIATEWKTRTYTDTPSITNRQESLSYGVYCVNSKGVGGGYSSNFSPFGTPYDAPYADSFVQARLTTSPWILERIYSTTCGWGLSDGGTNPRLDAQDGDGGCLVYTAGGNGAARLTSPLISIDCLTNPVLTFWACIPQTVSTLKVQVSNDSGLTPWVDAKTLAPGKAGEWTQYAVDLTPYRDYSRFQFGFTAYSTAASSEQMLVDNVRILNDVDYDLAVTEIMVPEQLEGGEKSTATVTVMNVGRKASSAYSVAFCQDGKEVGAKHFTTLAAGEEQACQFAFTATRKTGMMALTAKVVNVDDEGDANNRKTSDVKIRVNRFPAPESVEGERYSDVVYLNWKAPSNTAYMPIEENLETWESWSIGGIECNFDDNLEPVGEIIDEGYIEDFKVIDNDHRYTQYMASGMGYAFPHRGMGQACQVFDVEEYGYSASSIVCAHSGKKMLVFWSSPVQNDDYLIFPELAPSDKYISFWAKSASDKYGLETFEIMTSTTGDNREDFTPYERVADVPAGYVTDADGGYTFYEFYLPEDTRYVALHYDAKDVLALFVDDITYTPADGMKKACVGYNIYRNDERQNEKPVTELIYEDVLKESGDVCYTVTSVYENGESNYSNAYETTAIGPVNRIPAETDAVDYLAEGYFYTMTIQYLTDVPMKVFYGKQQHAGEVYFYTLLPNMFDGTAAPIVGTVKDNVISVPKQRFYNWYYEYEAREIPLYLSAAKVENGTLVELDDELRFRQEADGSLTPIFADGMKHAYVGVFDATGRCWVYNADINFAPTNVDGVTTVETAPTLPSSLYDLQGRRLAKPQTGIVIENNNIKLMK